MSKKVIPTIAVLLILIMGLTACQTTDTEQNTPPPTATSNDPTVDSDLNSDNGENSDIYSDSTPNSDSDSSQENPSEDNTSEKDPLEDNSSDNTPPQTPDTPWEWSYDTPENHGLNSAELDGLYNQITQSNILTSVIVKDGFIIDEYYRDGYDSTSTFQIHSSSKSITSTLFGIATDQGYFQDLTLPISHYFPSILESGSAYWQDITLWHLLTHTSGIDMSDAVYWYEWRASENWIDYILDRSILFEPGTGFNYSTGNTHLLSAIFEEEVGVPLLEFGRQYLFDPLDIDDIQLGKDAQGISDGGNGFIMNPYDMAKIGQLFVNDGVWNGERIVSSEWIAEATSSQFERPSGSADYGYQWWVRTFGSSRYPGYFAQGHAGQFIFVVPDIELVVVFTSDYSGTSSIYWNFVNDVVSLYERYGNE